MKHLFKKGESGNPNGRPKGSPNRTTAEMKEFMRLCLDENLPMIRENLLKLSKSSPATHVNLCSKFFPYYIPTMNKTELSGELDIDGEIKIVFSDEVQNKNDDGINDNVN